MDCVDFYQAIIKPTVKSLPNMYSRNVCLLLLGTAIHESGGLRYLVQKDGPALGVYQMEPATHRDIYTHFLSYNSKLKESLLATCYYMARPGDDALVHNLRYATCMARIHYYRVKEPIPDTIDPERFGQYWKTYYNTHLGLGTVADFVSHWNNIIAPHIEKLL